MSTSLISTWTSYTWRSDCWVPLNLLPGRRKEDEKLGNILEKQSQQRPNHDVGTITYSVFIRCDIHILWWERHGRMWI